MVRLSCVRNLTRNDGRRQDADHTTSSTKAGPIKTPEFDIRTTHASVFIFGRCVLRFRLGNSLPAVRVLFVVLHGRRIFVAIVKGAFGC